MEMEDVIIRALLDHGYTTDDILLYDNTEYISTFNPLTDDKNSKSCIIFKDSGILKMLNGTFERNGKIFTTMTPTEWLRSIQKMKYYIAYICYKNQFSKKDLTEYTEYLEDYMLSLAKKNKRFEEMRKIFYKNYILDKDIFGNEDSIFTIIKEKTPIIEKKQLETVIRNELTPFEKNAIMKYCFTRKVEKLYDSENFYGVVLEYGNYKKPAIAFDYKNGFIKYRLIFEVDKKYRFRAYGKYKDFYKVRQNFSDTCILVEGELEGLTISKYIDCDILCMHNTNTLPSEDSINNLSKYKNIIVKIDKDYYDQNKKVFDKIKNVCLNVIVDYKTEDIAEDYNSLDQKDMLTKELILNINNKEELCK